MTTRSKFDQELEQLHIQLMEMGALCEEAISDVSQALLKNDKELARQIMENGNEIDHIERDIERRCLNLLLRQQPVARDLRRISSALKMVTDMERIGDHAEDIAEIIIESKLDHTEIFNQIRLMSEDTRKMVKDSIDAYIKNDLALAQSVIQYDDKVDEEFARLKKDLILYISSFREGPVPEHNSECAVDLLMIGKYYERIGDHATNIAEWVEFSITGKHC